jgi:hypothetical protein
MKTLKQKLKDLLDEARGLMDYMGLIKHGEEK